MFLVRRHEIWLDRTGAPPPNPRTGVFLAERSIGVVAARGTRADQAAFGEAEAHRLRDAVQLAHQGVSGGGELDLDPFVRVEDHTEARDITGHRRHLPRGGLVAFPQGSIAPQARAGSDPEHETTGVTSGGFQGRRSYDRRGVAPSPALRPRRRAGFGDMRANRNGASGFRER